MCTKELTLIIDRHWNSAAEIAIRNWLKLIQGKLDIKSDKKSVYLGCFNRRYFEWWLQSSKSIFRNFVASLINLNGINWITMKLVDPK